MEPVTRRISGNVAAASEGAGRRVRAFRATDAFVIEAFRITTTLDGPAGRDLARSIRSVVVDCGGALVAASGPRVAERRWLSLAYDKLAESRYGLYLARRLGLIDLTRYRAVMGRHDAATRELDVTLEESEVPQEPR